MNSVIGLNLISVVALVKVNMPLTDAFYLMLSLEHFFLIVFLLLSIPFGEGSGTPLQYSCLETPVDRGAW